LEEPKQKKTKKRTKHANIVVYFAYVGRRNPWTDGVQILFGYNSEPGNNHVCQIWWRSVKGFLVGGVPSLPFPIDLAGRPYNSATLYRVHCDYCRLRGCC